MTELRLEITEILAYSTTITVAADIAERARSGDLAQDVTDAIDAALAGHVESSDDWTSGTVEERHWEVAESDLPEDDPRIADVFVPGEADGPVGHLGRRMASALTGERGSDEHASRF